jgi:hypothetical protein
MQGWSSASRKIEATGMIRSRSPQSLGILRLNERPAVRSEGADANPVSDGGRIVCLDHFATSISSFRKEVRNASKAPSRTSARRCHLSAL